MIKKLDAKDISKIMYLDDPHFNELFVCEIGEWVQFLMEHHQNEDFFMIGNFKVNEMNGYLVAYFVPLPVCKGVSVLYSKTAGITTNKLAMEELIKWSKSKGALSLDLITENVIGHSVYGFKKKATMMRLDL